MKKITLIIVAAAMLAPGLSRAETNDSPQFIWLYIEPGSRPGGLGKSFTGLADDANASFYNPGGLALQEKSGVTVMHEPRGVGSDLKDIFYDFVAFSYKTEKYGTFCMDVIYSDAGKSDIVDDQNNVLGTMHSYGAAPSLYWSYPLMPNLGVGGGVTYAYEHLTDLEGGVNQQLLFNVGTLYQTPVKGLSGGLALTNLGQNKTGTRVNEQNQQIEVSWPPPRTVRFGVGYNILSTDFNDLTAVGDMSKLLMNFDDGFGDELGQAVYSGGAEYIYAKMVAVRAGYYFDKAGEIKGLTLGFGFSYKDLSFDYARVPEGEAFGDVHRFAVGYLF